MIGSVTQVQQEMAAIEKRRRARERAEEPLTEAHAADEAAMEGEQAERERQARMADTGEAGKAFTAEIGAVDGPAAAMPGGPMPGAAAFDRGYLDSGRAAASPQQGPPNTSPSPPALPGVLTPVQMPGLLEVAGHDGPIVAAMGRHLARSATTMPVMPIPLGSA